MEQVRYKLILTSPKLYEEIELPLDIKTYCVGTELSCDTRLHKRLFFEQFELLLEQSEDGWSISCTDNLYLNCGDIRKYYTKALKHGDILSVCYQNSSTELFTIEYLIDFDYGQKDYDVEIDISGVSNIAIGDIANADIQIRSQYLNKNHILIRRENEKTFVIDQNTKYGVYVNGTRIVNRKEIFPCDFISLVDFSFYYKGDKLFCPKYPSLVINRLTYRSIRNQSTHFKFPKFVRNTRIQYVLPEEELQIQQAAAKPGKPSKSLVMTLIPSLTMLAMIIVLRGIMGGGGNFVIYSAVSMGIGIVMSIVTYFQEKKKYKKDYEERIVKYNEYIKEKRTLIEASRNKEKEILDKIYVSTEQSIAEVQMFGKRLFERELGDDDYLKVYLGRGTLESSNQIKYPEQEFIDVEDPLATIPKEVSEEYRFIEDVPIVSDFLKANGIGIVASPKGMLQAIKNLTIDIATRHFYYDVKMVYLLDTRIDKHIEWIKWLHNTENEKKGIRNIGIDEESRGIILDELYAVLSEREALKHETADYDASKQQRYVVFVVNATLISSHPVSRYFNNCSDLGFTFVFLEEYEEFIPQGCAQIIRIDGNQNGAIVNTYNGETTIEFKYIEIPDDVAKEAAYELGMISVDEVSLEGELTKNISLFELFGILSTDDLNLSERWGSSVVYKSLSAPIGVRSGGQVVYLDISDKSSAHGPHGLVAGTTGSGKSEVLQTYILSLASLFHPYEVGFVIIDFKGGGMANQFKNLPHLIGTITNIDGREINRSLLSIKAELVKRQELFSQAGVNHINDYIKLYKANAVTTPMPHLIMIVDEFAELKAEYPDFMKELISAARIGRTLGVHLILATQKPAGVVDAQIWSNSKFKLCLKVQTKEDSNEVIRTPLAAEIVEPGRAYFQVGNNEIFELFQSAYSGALVPEGNDADRVIEIYERNTWGKKKLVYTNKKKKSESGGVTQLQAVVDCIYDYCKNQNIDRLPGICLPSLPDRISTGALHYDFEGSGIMIPIGVYDDPEQQRQGEVLVDPSRENMYIVGSAQMGKTVLLQTIIYGLIRKYTPDQVNLYLIDCGSMVLKLFEDSKHIGGVVLSNEDEKCKNLFKLLSSTIVQRKKELATRGVGNYSSYLEAGYHDMPLIVVVIDNMAAFKEYFPNETDMLESLTREAQGVGISFIITAATSNAMSYRAQANFGRKMVLNCNDPSEYSNMFGHCRETPKETTGRGLFTLDRRILEYQVAIFGNSMKEADRSAELKEYIAQRNLECKHCAKKIPMVPDILDMDTLLKEEPALFRTHAVLPIGMEFSSIEYSYLRFEENGVLALLGDVDCKERFTMNLLRAISRTVVFHGIEAVVVDDKNKKLSETKAYGFVDSYSSDTSEGMQLVEDFCEEIDELHENEESHENTKILIINSVEVLRRISADKRLGKLLADAMRNACEVKSCILLSAMENQAIGFNSPEAMKVVKEQRQGILFAPITDNKVFEVSGRVKPDASFDNTMGYRFDGSNISRIKIFN